MNENYIVVEVAGNVAICQPLLIVSKEKAREIADIMLQYAQPASEIPAPRTAGSGSLKTSLGSSDSPQVNE